MKPSPRYSSRLRLALQYFIRWDRGGSLDPFISQVIDFVVFLLSFSHVHAFALQNRDARTV